MVTKTATHTEIRQGHVADQSEVEALWLHAGLSVPSADEWKALTQGNTAALLIAEHAGRIVGAAVATFDGWRAYIYHVVVADDVRRGGIAQQLMRTSEDLLRQAGAYCVFVMVPVGNTRGLALVSSTGYLPDGDTVLRKELS
jgi:ribosomal protein S18 acetylase RimI-like enzyme